MTFMTLGVLTTPAYAAGESVSVSPSTGLSDGQVVNVTFTTTGTTEATVFLGITQCGNATSAGAPLAVATADDCMGAAGLGTSLRTWGATGAGGLSGPVAPGTYTSPLTMKKTGIGANAAQCLPLAQATIPCRISVATASFAGSYTGPGYNFVATADFSYTAPATTTTPSSSTTSSSTTSSSTTTSTTGSTTTTTTGSTTTTTTGSTTTSSSTTSSSTTSSTASTSTTTTTAPTTTTTAPTTTTTAPTTTTTAPTTTTTAPTTTTTAPTTTTTAPATKTFDCTDIPLPPSSLALSKNRCLSEGEAVTVSAPAGTFTDGGTAFVIECNPDPAIPTDGSGCNVGGLGVGVIGGDGSMGATQLVIKTGQIGSDARSTCPPSQAQADAGAVNCTIAAAPGGDATRAAAAQFTIEGQTVELPVDPGGNPTTPTTAPATGGTGGGGADVLGTTTLAPAVVTATGTLPYTGLAGNTWFIVGLAIAVVDLGAVASSYARRRMVG